MNCNNCNICNTTSYEEKVITIPQTNIEICVTTPKEAFEIVSYLLPHYEQGLDFDGELLYHDMGYTREFFETRFIIT